MSFYVRWALGVGLAVLLVAVPFVHYRAGYARAKRFRIVTPGVLYRSGQMTADGLAEAITRHGIRTVVNLQNEAPDPDVPKRFLCHRTVKESDLCRRLGVHFQYLPVDLISRRRVPDFRPVAIERFLALMDDPANHPVLLHCRAGLHRTGVLVAVFRMEYQGWTAAEAIRELKDNGFGDFACTAANDYIKQYILTYRRGVREPE